MQVPGSTDHHILVVEDNAIHQKLTSLMLERMGLSHVIAYNGQEALDIVHRGATNPSLILMDCVMPVMCGFEATKRIRAWENETGRQRLPIIATTASVFQTDQDLCMAAGMDDFLAKPILLPSLKAILAKWLPDHLICK